MRGTAQHRRQGEVSNEATSLCLERQRRLLCSPHPSTHTPTHLDELGEQGAALAGEQVGAQVRGVVLDVGKQDVCGWWAVGVGGVCEVRGRVG